MRRMAVAVPPPLVASLKVVSVTRRAVKGGGSIFSAEVRLLLCPIYRGSELRLNAHSVLGHGVSASTADDAVGRSKCSAWAALLASVFVTLAEDKDAARRGTASPGESFLVAHRQPLIFRCDLHTTRHFWLMVYVLKRFARE